MRMLIVEDEVGMAEALKATFEKYHYTVDLAHDGEMALDLVLMDNHDVVILDIMLPKKDGIEVLKEIRHFKLTTPVILLTARDAVEDRISGLDAGADDYLPKPFDMNELLARVRALGRRHGTYLEGDALEFGDVTYSHALLELRVVDQMYTLTKKEGHLLELLMKSRGRIIEKEHLLDKVWGFEDGAVDNHVEVYISFLRKKLKALNAKTKIKTVRGLGYRLESGDD